MHVTVGYWMHGVTILYAEGSRKATKAGASGSPSDKEGTWESPQAQQNGDPAVVHVHSVILDVQWFARGGRRHLCMCGPSWSYHVQTFFTFFCFTALETCTLDLVPHGFPLHGDASANAARQCFAPHGTCTPKRHFPFLSLSIGYCELEAVQFGKKYMRTPSHAR